jgi:hypothetical protein
MAANPDVFGWRAEGEHYADENFGDRDQQIVTSGNLPVNSVSVAWCGPAVTSPFMAGAGKLGLPRPKEITELVLWRARPLHVLGNRCGSADPSKLANTSPSKTTAYQLGEELKG